VSVFRIDEALRRVEHLAAGQPKPPDVAEPPKPPDVAEPPRPPDVAAESATKPAAEGFVESPAGDEFPEQTRAVLTERARHLPDDATRWESLLRNTWNLGTEEDGRWWFWTLLTFRVGGCRLVAHKGAGWAIRFDAETIGSLRAQGVELLFESEDDYRALARKHLAPRRDELARLLQLSSLGVLEDVGDLSWAWIDSDRRRKTAAAQGVR